jgi:hypothetical protein
MTNILMKYLNFPLKLWKDLVGKKKQKNQTNYEYNIIRFLRFLTWICIIIIWFFLILFIVLFIYGLITNLFPKIRRNNSYGYNNRRLRYYFPIVNNYK